MPDVAVDAQTASAPAAGGRASRLIVGAAVALAAALLISRADHIPLWDGGVYADCAVDAALNGLRPYYLRCVGHASYAAIALMALPQLVAPGSELLLHAVNGLFFLAAAFGFHRLARAAFPRSPAADRSLLVAAFLLQPAFLANVLQPSLDLAVLAAFLLSAALLLERRWVWVAAAGTVLVFSKETGVLLYALLVGCYSLWTVRRLGIRVFVPRGRQSVVSALAPMVCVATPLALYAAYAVAYLLLRPGQSLIWGAGTTHRNLLEYFLVPRVDVILASYLALLFVLSFSWVLSASIGADLAVGAVRAARRRSGREVPGAEPAVLGFLTVLTAVIAYALTRLPTFSNVRYLMCALALLLIPFYASLVRLRLGRPARRLVLGAYLAALVVSSMRTVDPLSRWLFGTFSFGTHEMLRVTSITGECCARDQLVYNLEFTFFHDLIDEALATLRPDSTAIVLPRHARWFTIDDLDARSLRRTLRREGVVKPLVLTTDEVARLVEPPASAFYLALPNHDLEEAMRDLSAVYELGPMRRFARNGYALAAYPLTRKQR